MRWTGVPDYLSADGAHQLAERLTRFWDRRGAVVMTRLEPHSGEKTGGTTIYCVRSSLHNGLPVQTSSVLGIPTNGSDTNVAAQAEHVEVEAGTEAIPTGTASET